MHVKHTDNSKTILGAYFAKSIIALKQLMCRPFLIGAKIVLLKKGFGTNVVPQQYLTKKTKTVQEISDSFKETYYSFGYKRVKTIIKNEDSCIPTEQEVIEVKDITKQLIRHSRYLVDYYKYRQKELLKRHAT